jgi:polysaccharide pyruvyl transferase WcaK-like protein
MLRCRVWGWYGKHNIGDESYKFCFPALFPNIQFEFEGSESEYDLCVLGGGDILDPQFVQQALACRCPNKYILSVSAGPKAPIDLLNGFKQICVRDRRSEEFLRAKGVKCSYMPDIALTLRPDVERGRAMMRRKFAEEGLDLYNKQVGVVLNAHLIYSKEGMLARDMVAFLKAAQDIGKLADETSASFIFFPMSTGMPCDDRISNGYVASRCKFWKKNWLVQERLSVQETLDLVSACDLIISSRLHSSIFSLISHVPFLDLVHHDKNRSFLETMHLEGHGLSYWSFSFEELKNALDDRLGSPEAFIQKLHWTHRCGLEVITREAGCMFH